MSQTALQLCEAALALPRDERATLVAILADSLDQEDDPVEVAKAWDARRVPLLRKRKEANLVQPILLDGYIFCVEME